MAAGSILVFHVWRYSAPNRASVDFGRAGWFLPDLSFGVVLFFTLSGFLLYMPFVAAILRGGARPATFAGTTETAFSASSRRTS